MRPKVGTHVPADVAAINKALRLFLNSPSESGRLIGSARCGVYAFFDYDKEPIYVGQTWENLRARIGRHLTNQRTDAVAMNVLDPFEVAEIEVWPLFELDDMPSIECKRILNLAEFTVFQLVLSASSLGAVLNEKDVTATDIIPLPRSYRGRIVPDTILDARAHPDVRIARRASTIARLAQVISERDVSVGLRRTLLVQAQRLELLARRRYSDILSEGAKPPLESVGEETGEQLADSD